MSRELLALLSHMGMMQLRMMLLVIMLLNEWPLMLLVLMMHLRMLVCCMSLRVLMASMGYEPSICRMHWVAYGPARMMHDVIRPWRPTLSANQASCKLMIRTIRASPITRPLLLIEFSFLTAK